MQNRTSESVAAGKRHTCAVLDDKSVKCWGPNDYGQLGLGDTAKRGIARSDMGDSLPAVALGTVSCCVWMGVVNMTLL